MKSLFAAGFQIRAGWINNVTNYESEMLKSYYMTLIKHLLRTKSDNHALSIQS